MAVRIRPAPGLAATGSGRATADGSKAIHVLKLFRRRQKKTQRRRKGRWRPSVVAHVLPLAALCGLVALRVADPAPVEAFRLQVFDLYQRLAPRKAQGFPAVIVDIDNASLAAYGQWPWPRTLLAQLVAQLVRKGAVVVGFDVIFAEPDRMSPPALARELPGLDEKARTILRNLPTNDQVFADMIKRTRVVLAQAPVPDRIGDLAGARPVKTGIAEIGGDPRPFLLSYRGVVRNLPVLEQSAKGLGSITLAPEADGVARRVPLIVRAGDHLLPSLTIEMLRVATGQRAVAIKSNKAGVDSVVVAGVNIHTDRNGLKWVHYAAPDPARYVSAKDVLSGRIPTARIKGKLVLVGTSATSLGDIKATPVSPTLPGVEVHAQLLETILAKADLVRPNYALGAEMVLLVATGLLIVILTPLAGALWTLIFGSAVAGSLAYGAWYLYDTRGILLDVSYSMVAGFLIYALITYGKYLREEGARKSIRRIFSQYLSEAVVDRLAANPDQLRLGGEMRNMTVLFSDVQGFTTISERLTPEALTTLMNRVLTRMTTPILKHQGTIDKYIGDSVMAFWNAPLADAAHARNACHAALEMQREMGELNRELQEEAEAAGEPHTPINIRVGLNTGDCNVGNLGSEQHFNYSVLGDAVNLASRLEGQGKFYGCPIIVGESTAEGASDLAFLQLDLIRVKGKHQAVRVFALLGDATLHDDPGFATLKKVHEEMLRAYRNAEWQTAKRQLARCRAAMGDLPLARLYDIYQERIDSHPTVVDVSQWDGVYEALQK